MRIQVICHVDFENEGFIQNWAKSKGYPISRTLLHLGEKLPGMDAFDLLVIMGGPMNIYEEKEFPYLVEEKRWIKQAVDNGKKVLGICLGAQLLSDVLGGKVTRNRQKEIGWFDVELLDGAASEPVFKGFPKKFTAFHWHGDTFSIPPGAVPAARSEVCENQAFVFNKKAVGLQFHLETTKESLEKLIDNCKSEIVEKDSVQSAEKMRKIASLAGSNALMGNLLDQLGNL